VAVVVGGSDHTYVETTIDEGAAVFTRQEVNMTVLKEVKVEILRLYHAEKWPPNTIARQLRIHHSVVKRVLTQDGVPAATINARPRKVDPYLGLIEETLKKYPKLAASRLYVMARERGYTGGPSRFRAVVAQYRPRSAEAYQRLRTLPGEQAQIDWGYFGKIKFGNCERRLSAFVMVLSWSRQIFLHFYPGESMFYFLHGHAEAFRFFGSVPREILYDNLKSAVLERQHDAIRFNPELLELAAHYRYLPKPVNVARGNEKGRVERAIQYIRHAFFAAREWEDLNDLNEQARKWCLEEAAERKCPGDHTITVREAFEQEKKTLYMHPANPFPVAELASVRVGKTPYVRFNQNDYSVPHTYVQKTLTVVADMERVRISSEGKEIAQHQRSWERGRQIEDAAHIKALWERKQEAKQHRGMDRLHHAAPSARKLLELAAERGNGLGGLTTGLLKLLDLYGAQATEEAIQEVLKVEAVHLSAVRQVLERKRREQDLPPPVEIEIHNDDARNLVVVPHSLSTYDTLHIQ
jgi:transposase